MAGGTTRRMDATTALAGALMVFAWGTSAVATKVGLESYDPGPWTLLRFAITCTVMLGWALATRMRLPARRDVLPVGAAELVELIERHVAAGLTKFVLRPVRLEHGWDDELAWLARTVLPLQS